MCTTIHELVAILQALYMWYNYRDMHPRLSRKKELAKRTVVYLVMTASMITLLGLLMLLVLGYQFDLKNRSVEQMGLVQYDSSPRSATVSVDGTVLGGKTQTKGSVLPGKRQFAMQLAGYESWQKTLDISAGVVTWLSYPRLVPTERRIVTTYETTGLQTTLAAPNGRYMALWQVEDGVPRFGIVDVRSSDRPVIDKYEPTTEQLGGLDSAHPAETHGFSLKSWSRNSRYIIATHEYQQAGQEAQVEWLWIDRESPDSMVNLTNLFSLGLTDVKPLDNRSVFILSSDDVREASVSTGSISKPLITGVRSFDTYTDDVVTYIATDATNVSAGVWRRGSPGPVVVANVPVDGESIHIAASRYFNKDTIAVSIGRQVTFYRGDIPTSEAGVAALLRTATDFTFNHPVEHLQFNRSGQFLVAEDDKGFVSYDLERAEVSQNVQKYSTGAIDWLDAHHVTQVDSSGELIMQEFDGLNATRLMPIVASHAHLLTQDGKYVYGWQEQDGTVMLRRLSMTIQ